MLRESVQRADGKVSVSDVTEGLSQATEIAQAPMLVEFAEAVVRRDRPTIDRARAAIEKAMGAQAMVDAAATVAAFHGFVRIADTIGIPFTTAVRGADDPALRESAGINRFYRVQAAGTG